MSVLPLIERQMCVRPDAVAVVHNGRRITYRQLQEETARIAQGLRREGVQPGSLVAVYLDRSPEMLAALLGIWQVGAAYLPLDPTHPSDRISFMAEDSGAAFILSQTELLASVPRANAKVLNLHALSADSPHLPLTALAAPAPDSLAYVIYTSGSTGKPKGAKISHGALANTIQAVRQEQELQPSDVMLASNSIAFDISGLEFYLPLTSGARVHLADRELAADGPRLMEVLREAGITVMIGLNTTYRLLLAAGWQGDPNLQLTVGGETLSLELARLLAERSRALWNHYGPTETSICATTEKIEANVTKITLGRPLNNVRVYVLDASRQPLPPGSMGEIYIGGQGVGQGYLNQPELTSARFLPDPFDPQPGATMYKTGDFGALLPDGRLDFFGRVDEQVKIRGFRIELEEVEAALHDCQGVMAAVVRAIEFAPDDKRLIAFVVTEQAPDPDQLRSALRRRLPYYMVPSEYIGLDAFPVTPNGKVDRRALDALRLQAVAAPLPDPAHGDLEAGLQQIWQTLLRIGSVRFSDNFFDLGGHSLLAVRMLVQVEKQFGAKIPVSLLAERPTIEKLADYIRHHREGQHASLVKIQGGGSRCPLFVAHGIGGSLLTFRELAAELGEDQPVYGLQIPESLEAIGASDLGPDLITSLAARYLEEIRTVVPDGPYQLAGHSSAGLILVEVARQLREMGCEVRLLALLDADIRPGKSWDKPWKNWDAFKGFVNRNRVELALSSKYGVVELIRRRMHHHKLQFQLWFVQRFHGLCRHFQASFVVEGYLAFGLLTFRMDTYLGDLVLFVAEDEPRNHDDPTLGWRSKILGRLDVVSIPGGHHSIFLQPHVRELAIQLQARLNANSDTVVTAVATPTQLTQAPTRNSQLQWIG